MSSPPASSGSNGKASPRSLALAGAHYDTLNRLSAATREFGAALSSSALSTGDTTGSHSASSPPRMSPKYLRNLFEPVERKADTECLFRVRISGIQCRNLQGRKFSGKSDPFVEFYWDDPEEQAPYATPVIKGDLNPNFKGLLIAFEYRATLASLPKRNLIVKVFSNRTFQSKTLIGSAQVDLWSVATGPVHHDHHLNGCDNGRIVFNCYMEQCSEWNISMSEVGVMMPAITNELDRPEGHDFQEDASLPLKKFAVSYKCTIGTSETFYLGEHLKHAEKRVIAEINEVRQLSGGRGQMAEDPDGGFLALYEKYKKEMAPGDDPAFDKDIRNTTLFGQTWLSLEKSFEDALQERLKKKYDDSVKTNGLGLDFAENFVTSRFEQPLTLPSFGVELYQLWAESYTEVVPELSAEFAMQADADLFAMDGLEAHLDWRRFHKAIFDEFGEKALKSQEDEAEDNGYQKFVLCAPTFEEQREWIEVLTQNATAETAVKTEEQFQWDVSEVTDKLESLAGKHDAAGEVQDSLMPYTASAVKE
ncbi:hypothetical protein ATCC90586_007126 [Pythium insidiosum]|nr:hypothetical protein ATCC90586_007126 [Pythium insidiosum]